MTGINISKLYEDLEKYSSFDQDDTYVEKFLDTVDKIIMINDPNSIPILMKYFDDETEYGWVLEELRTSMEHYKDEDYVKQFCLCIEGNIAKAKEWLSYTLFSILNNQNCLKVFRNTLNLVDKGSLLELFSYMKEESPHHKELIEQIEIELAKN